MITIKSTEEIDKIRQAGRIAAKTLAMIEPLLKAHLTTNEINQKCHDFIVKEGAKPAALNYHGFPKSICISINDIVYHGIPDDRPLREGDIVNIDVAIEKNGYFADASKTFAVGNISKIAKNLLQCAERALISSIQTVNPSNVFYEIGMRVKSIALDAGFTVVEDFLGHGIGKVLHEPNATLYYDYESANIKIQPGMVFAIEPMLNIGAKETTRDQNGWTTKTVDGQLSAQFEHTVIVTENGYEIATRE